MKVWARTITIGLAVLGAVLLLSIPPAYAAKASFDQPPGEPPYGLAVQGDRGGTKLYGVIELEYTVHTENLADILAVARLRKGTEVKTFAAALSDINFQDPKIIQLAVTDALEDQIISGFFPGETGLLCIWFKSASEYAKSILYGGTSFFEVMDFEIAVSACEQ